MFLKHDFATMGKFQMKTLFLGMMHFQDEYTYDIKRVEKCDIHYAMPDGEVLPFCTFNVFPEVYRDKIQKQYSIPSKEWEKHAQRLELRRGQVHAGTSRRSRLREAYKKTYDKMEDYFSLPVNKAEAALIAAKTGRTYPSTVKAAAASFSAPKVVMAAPKEQHTHEEKDGGCGCGSGAGSCGCGGGSSGGSCGCGGQ